MQRSEVNAILCEGAAFFDHHGFALPRFAHLAPEALLEHRTSAIFSHGLGWDITDYGQGRFDELGLFLFTVRNGTPENLKSGQGMVYAEKIMISRQDQISPMHRHIVKTEDIINRGGATLVLELFAADPAGDIDRDATMDIPMDGVLRQLPGGSRVALEPGESITLEPGIWHAFWGEDGDVLIGEVSTVNDDHTDNIFVDPIGRFAEIAEDEAPWRLLVSDYAQPPALAAAQ